MPAWSLGSTRGWFDTGGRSTAAAGRSAGMDAVAELVALQAEYLAWFEALPEATRDSATVGLEPTGLTRGEALQAILDLDLDELAAIERATRLRTRLAPSGRPDSIDQPGT